MPEDENELLHLIDLTRLNEDIEVRLNGYHGRVIWPDEYEQNKVYDFNNFEPKVEEIKTVNGDNRKLNGMPLTVKGHVPLVNNKTGLNCGKISIKLDISYDLDEEILNS